MSIEKMPPHKSNGRNMSLGGEEAMQLYAAEIARKVIELNTQVALLQAEIAERKQLLRDLD
jgi:uncharacterized small protein (DUF1192 family)